MFKEGDKVQLTQAGIDAYNGISWVRDAIANRKIEYGIINNGNLKLFDTNNNEIIQVGFSTTWIEDYKNTYSIDTILNNLDKLSSKF